MPLPRMAEAELAVCSAAANIPAELTARFDTADKLSDADRALITHLAEQALSSFQIKPDAKAES